MNNNPQTILVVDDDIDILDAITMTLEMEGYTVKTSSKAEYAEGLIRSRGVLPHLIILDVLLSGKDGRVICKKLKSSRQTKDIPIIMFSAHPDADRSTKEVGADDFIAKPFEMNDLIHKISRYIDIP